MAATNAGITRTSLGKISTKLVGAIRAGYDEANAAGPIFVRWFGTAATAKRAVVLASMWKMRDIANGHATISLTMKADSEVGAGANAYAWPQGKRATDGQYILNLGSGFGTVYASPTLALRNATGDGQALKTIAHELAHLVFSANIAPACPIAYEDEHYREAALQLVIDNPDWASWNADNYAYFIEACTP